MSLDEFYDQIDFVTAEHFPIIVQLKYKYTHETDYTISNEILDYYDDKYIWLNDWHEGQQDIQVITWITVDYAMDLIQDNKGPNSTAEDI